MTLLKIYIIGIIIKFSRFMYTELYINYINVLVYFGDYVALIVTGLLYGLTWPISAVLWSLFIDEFDI